MSADTQPAVAESSSSQDAVTPLPYKIDWYQTDSLVVVSFLAKNIAGEKAKVRFAQNEIDVSLVFKNEEALERTLHLENPVVPERCSYKITTSKLEMKLVKLDDIKWIGLEKTEEQKKAKEAKNWDKLVCDVNDEQEGEAALNALFQKIYSEGSDEVKKAMNKSFVESGGTELNTNWDAVSKSTVSIKPPEGMEWKKWDS